MEMAEVPFLIGHQFFQAAQELGGLAAFDPRGHVRDLVDKAGRRRMGDDVIDGEIVGRQVFGGIKFSADASSWGHQDTPGQRCALSVDLAPPKVKKVWPSRVKTSPRSR